MRVREGAILTTTKVPKPRCPWPTIPGTYTAITKKLNTKNRKGETAPKEYRLAAIDYWMERLQEDRKSIDAGGDALTR